MYCKWVLEEDCSSLRGLMLRFDSEVELESHELGRSLLDMIRYDDVGFINVPQPVPFITSASPFDAVRDRLAAAGTTIRGLREQGIPASRFLMTVCGCEAKPTTLRCPSPGDGFENHMWTMELKWFEMRFQGPKAYNSFSRHNALLMLVAWFVVGLAFSRVHPAAVATHAFKDIPLATFGLTSFVSPLRMSSTFSINNASDLFAQ